ncbi:MAG: hypothetical protein LBJ95_04160 [Oscillospiraceae bacterium]|nr:hypothetical protein [Oscillospiraceae bacterium]
MKKRKQSDTNAETSGSASPAGDLRLLSDDELCSIAGGDDKIDKITLNGVAYRANQIIGYYLCLRCGTTQTYGRLATHQHST